MKAVSNSSVLIALSAIQQLDLLQQRFPDGILIPQAVWHEVVTTGGGRPGSQAVATASFIQVCSITNAPLAQVLQAELDYGEAEAIALCSIPSVLRFSPRDSQQERWIGNSCGIQVCLGSCSEVAQ